MRLSTPFVRLPLRVDATALAAEVEALDPAWWRAHPEGATGNTAVPLVSVGGSPTDDSTRGSMLPTQYLGALPYARRVLAALDTVVGRSRLMRIEEEGELVAHVDTNYYWRDHIRVHVPVLTTPEVEFVCDDESVHMAAGEVWVFDTWRRHRVRNPAAVPRIHLVVDTVGSASLWSLIEHPDCEPRVIAVAASEPDELVTENVNYAAVMSPWEFEQAFDALMGDLAISEPDVADSLRAAMLPTRHAWRAAWARYGDQPEGRDAFAVLRRQADDLVKAAGGSARLPNDILVVEAIRQHVLRPALGSETGRGDARVRTEPVPAAARTTDVAAARAPARITCDRPVFVVSSPRAGSSLLFETLARSRGLVTIGGESHRVIESIGALHPSAHGWSSNRLEAEHATPDTVRALHDGFAQQLRDRNGQAVTAGAVRMLEKTPKNSLRVPFLAAAFPDARFVYLYRDPRETISSMLDAWKSGRFVTYPRLPGWEGEPWSLLLVPGWRELSQRPLSEVVTKQWAIATSTLLDDLAVLDPDRWCVASYDRLVGDPQAEIQRLCEFCEVEWDVDLDGPLPLSRHTLDSPHPDKWRRNADALEPHWDLVREVAMRAHDVFAAPPRVRPVRPPRSDGAPAAGAGVRRNGEEAASEQAPFRSVHTSGFTQLLDHSQCSLLVSTYQSGRVIAVRMLDGRLNTHFRGFQSPMGIARRGTDLAIGTKTVVQLFQNQPAVVARLDNPDMHDACFMPRRAHTTGDIRIHDLAFAGDNLWAVNTRFSCLSTFDESHSFVPRWRPRFVSALSPDDRCHLNGFAIVDDRPKFVTALGLTDDPAGWRENKAGGGVILDVDSGDAVATGLCMPHSPRWYDGRLWVLESGRGSLGVVDVATGTVQEVVRMPGFTRGLGFAGPFAFVGLSQVRESMFEGLPLTADGVERTCGVWVVDLRTGEIAAWLEFEGVVEEIFEVAVLHGIRCPEIVEPGSELVDAAFVLPDAAINEVPESARS
ncbi:MAG: TIGR03032 family protein [Acidimicrobiia bacterium]